MNENIRTGACVDARLLVVDDCVRRTRSKNFHFGNELSSNYNRTYALQINFAESVNGKQTPAAVTNCTSALYTTNVCYT